METTTIEKEGRESHWKEVKRGIPEGYSFRVHCLIFLSMLLASTADLLIMQNLDSPSIQSKIVLKGYDDTEDFSNINIMNSTL